MNATDSAQKSAIHYAVYNGLADVCLALMKNEKFMELNAVARHRETAPHFIADNRAYICSPFAGRVM